MGTGVPGDKILRIILKNGVILSLHQKSDGGGQNILRGGVSLYRMILISGFYCTYLVGGIFAYAPYPVGGQLPRSKIKLYGLFLTNLTDGITGY